MTTKRLPNSHHLPPRGIKHWRQYGSHSLSTGRQRQSRAIRRSISDVDADRPISLVPISYGIRTSTAPVHGKRLATTSMRRSTYCRSTRTRSAAKGRPLIMRLRQSRFWLMWRTHAEHHSQFSDSLYRSLFPKPTANHSYPARRRRTMLAKAKLN